ncbi:hypothetical protein CYMTET_4653, partial [Cymbomonas tetramitiformis]
MSTFPPITPDPGLVEESLSSLHTTLITTVDEDREIESSPYSRCLTPSKPQSITKSESFGVGGGSGFGSVYEHRGMKYTPTKTNAGFISGGYRVAGNAGKVFVSQDKSDRARPNSVLGTADTQSEMAHWRTDLPSFGSQPLELPLLAPMETPKTPLEDQPEEQSVFRFHLPKMRELNEEAKPVDCGPGMRFKHYDAKVSWDTDDPELDASTWSDAFGAIRMNYSRNYP